MGKARWTSEQFKKQGLVETPNGFVKSTSLVAKGNVVKLQSPAEKLKTLEIIKPLSPGEVRAESGIPMFNEAPTPKQVMDAFRQTGIMYVKAPIGDTFLLPNGQYVDVKYRFVIDPI